MSKKPPERSCSRLAIKGGLQQSRETDREQNSCVRFQADQVVREQERTDQRQQQQACEEQDGASRIEDWLDRMQLAEPFRKGVRKEDSEA
ncbi:hypothetical protein ACOBR2_07450 [Telmatobacter bradus]|uniref:hypothetical protein n=1 Tax=Telmatobacter bradus TaxID=474953 RepID=UPI003B431B1B